MKKNFFIVIVLFVAMAGYYFYREFNTPHLAFQLEEKSFTIYGELFNGRYDSQVLEKLFYRTKKFSDSLETALVIVNYGSDEDAEVVNQFVGILATDGTELPEGWDTRQFNASSTISTLIDSHNAFMPKPEKVREQALKFAEENGKTLSAISIEVYRSDRELYVYFLSE